LIQYSSSTAINGQQDVRGRADILFVCTQAAKRSGRSSPAPQESAENKTPSIAARRRALAFRLALFFGVSLHPPFLNHIQAATADFIPVQLKFNVPACATSTRIVSVSN